MTSFHPTFYFVPLDCGCQMVLDGMTSELLEIKRCDLHSAKPGSAIGVRDIDYNRRNRKSKSRRTYNA